jgi:hypothetical protein
MLAQASSLLPAPISHTLLMFLVIFGVLGLVGKILDDVLFEKKRQKRKKYYRENYLQSEDWKRKRHVVLKRDNWKCVYCGKKASEVHHKRYARVNIGKEPIEWLISVCPKCHAMQHEK